MRKNIIRFVFCLFLLIGGIACQNERTISGQSESMQSESGAESVDDSVVSFTEGEIDYMAIKDGLFDDFVYRFMQDSLFQHARIHFPLTCRVDGVVKEISEREWLYDSIYSAAYEYTSIYDGCDTLENVGDIKAQKASIEVVDLKKERVRLYHFNRNDYHWILSEIDEHFFDHDNNHGFFSFYGKFANDEAYQLKHIQDPLYFKTYDAENFQEIEGWVSVEQWPDYRTYLPNEKIINIIYDDVRPSSSYRRLSIGSPSSGMSCSLLFKRTGDTWKLVSMEI